MLQLATQWTAKPSDAFEHQAPAPRPRMRLVPGEDVSRGSADDS